ncbi:DUF1311 domain-containing protein [Paramixta manurensis]|uniref:DUF1311 domain-containing protein n=1 Tax=Paramixta manurensis TaxID=2740817 RepID=A0A6M8UA09_9GAMM|nr:DUF1311 domain-containing protein [Erwiniaceae bacterium PD-1]
MLLNKLIRASIVMLYCSALSGFAQDNQLKIEGSQWKVSQVNVNTASERTLNYQYDDNKLVGRLIAFGSKSITSTLPEKTDCQQPTYQPQKTTLNQLISSSMSGDDSANAKNYDLGIDGNHPINSFKILCHSGSFGRDMSDANAWVAMPDTGQAFINWYDGTLLTLTRLTPESNVSRSLNNPSTTASSDFDEELNGQWQIKEVHINTFIAYRPDILENDPELVGRIINFEASHITGDLLTSQNCIKTKYIENKAISLDTLLRLTSGDDVSKINAKSYNLNVSGGSFFKPLIISCSEGRFGPKGNKVGNWLVKLDANTILTNWYSDSYLVLKRLPAHPQPNPGFDCSKASSAAEKTICSSFELSAWDRSVNNAFNMLLFQTKHNSDDAHKEIVILKSEQQTWLKERNTCGSDVQCLEKKMRERTGLLVAKAKGS